MNNLIKFKQAHCRPHLFLSSLLTKDEHFTYPPTYFVKFLFALYFPLWNFLFFQKPKWISSLQLPGFGNGPIWDITGPFDRELVNLKQDIAILTIKAHLSHHMPIWDCSIATEQADLRQEWPVWVHLIKHIGTQRGQQRHIWDDTSPFPHFRLSRPIWDSKCPFETAQAYLCQHMPISICLFGTIQVHLSQ